MKAVLMAIHPEWCEKIFSGEKTIEVRKIAPKLKTPYKVYAYCTKARHNPNDWVYHLPNDRTLYFGANARDVSFVREEGDFRNGMVIGEFVCDEKHDIQFTGASYTINNDISLTNSIARQSCLQFDDMFSYLGIKGGAALHITKPKRYDTPKELSEFGTVCNKYENDECDDCPYLQVYVNSYPCDDCVDTWCGVDNIKPLTRPPQSWCYVEEIEE